MSSDDLPLPAGSEKAERLGCLFLTLLNSPNGITYADIRREMSYHYPDNESGRRKFERDKKDLKEIGIEIEHDSHDPRGHVYRIPDRVFMVSSFRLGRRDTETLVRIVTKAISHLQNNENTDRNLFINLESLLFKLLFSAPDLREIIRIPEETTDTAVPAPETFNPDIESEAHKLSLIQSAMQQLRIIRFEYPSSPGSFRRRTAAPAGVLSYRGRWCLVAEDLESGQMKHYYLDQLRNPELTDLNYKKNKAFSVRKYSLHPLNLNLEKPVTVLLKPAAEYEEKLLSFLEGYPQYTVTDDSVYKIHTTNPEALFIFMLSNPGLALQAGPAEILNRLAEYRNKLIKLYQV